MPFIEGLLHDGGYVICGNPIPPLSENSIVYSFGVGFDFGFDMSIIHKHNVKIFAFDPTPQTIEWVAKQKLHENIKFYPFGLLAEDKEMDLYPPSKKGRVSYSIMERKARDPNKKIIKAPFKRLSTIMNELGHDHIDILKMDIEGAEYGVFHDMISQNIKPTQITVEFHTPVDSYGGCIGKIRRYGYNLFWRSKTKREVSFILREAMPN